jgi:hypothetical protein
MAGLEIGSVSIERGFWKDRIEAGRRAGIPSYLEVLEKHGVLDNFRRISGRSRAERSGPVHRDSDLYKWMEAAAYSLQRRPDRQLEERLEAVIEDVVAAQGRDGYLNTYFVEERADERFSNLERDHELYCAGHLIQAAVAHHRATGRRKLLDCATRFADYLLSVFGPGRRRGFSGHPELEMAMVEMYRATGRREYLDFAGYLLEQLDFAGRREMEGHAVRACYACCGGADYFAETGEEETWGALTALWKDMSRYRVYITGGVGSRYVGESFGERYELPNLRAYAETCAAVANVMWSWRMLLLTGETAFADMMERVLYNGFLSGVSLSGDRYFYVNPLESSGRGDGWGHERKEWYSTPCCLGNVQRTLASLPGYVYGRDETGIWINLYQSSTLETRSGGSCVEIGQETGYPWSGEVRISVRSEPPREFALRTRIPAWSVDTHAEVGGETLDPEPGTYLEIRREWGAGGTVQLRFGMPVRLVEAHPRVREDYGAVAISRGPLIYCVESVDNPGIRVRNLMIDRDAEPRYEFMPDLLGGVGTVVFRGIEVPDGGPLYAPLGRMALEHGAVDVRAIPYYAWANRGRSSMLVWIPYRSNSPEE